MIDSEQVPWGKGEKHPVKGGEIVPETIYLQRVGAPQGVTACLLKNEPTSLFYVACIISYGEHAEWKRGLIARLCIARVLHELQNSRNASDTFVAWTRPEAGWSNHEQVELHRKMEEGPNPLAVQHYGMTCG